MSTAVRATASTTLAELLAALELTHHGGAIEVVETPGSWVLLTPRQAYKVKKSVDLGEARYRSAANRRQACLDEVRLNRDLAPGVHLGVTPLVRDAAGDLHVDASGEAVEWAVKMRRLRRESNLQWLIEHGDLTKNQVSSLAAVLADFYFGCPPETDVLDDLCARLRRRVAENGEEADWRLPRNLRIVVRRVVAAQNAYLDNARTVLNHRMCDGRVVDGHGDLCPEHIFLERRPVVIDRVESSAARRRSDALDDLCALTMELRRLQRADVAQVLVAAYRSRTGDDGCSHLEAFYRSLHACARAKQAYSAADVSGRSPRRLATALSYLDQAEHDADAFG